MPARLAPEDWIGYVIKWSRRQRPRHWDWEQAAIDGLYQAHVTWRPGKAAKHWIDWQLRGAAADLRRYHGRTCRSGGVCLSSFGIEFPDCKTCEPWQIAAIREEF
jgi:hypothetical protein